MSQALRLFKTLPDLFAEPWFLRSQQAWGWIFERVWRTLVQEIGRFEDSRIFCEPWRGPVAEATAALSTEPRRCRYRRSC